MERIAVFVQMTITGTPVWDISHLVAGGTYTDQLVGIGDATVHLTATAEVDAGQLTPQEVFFRLNPNEHSIVLAKVLDDGTITTILWAGIILGVDYDDDSELTEVYAEQIRTIFQHRLTFGVGNFPQGDLKITGQQRGAACAAILGRGTGWSSEWNLPLDMPAGGGGAFSTDISRWDVSTIEDALVQLEKYGAEIRFRPYFTAGRNLRYQVLVAEQIVTVSTTISLTAAESPILKYRAGKDGRSQSTGAFVTGKGQGSQLPFAWAGQIFPGYPIRDSYRAASDISAVSTLQGYANSAIARNRDNRRWASFQIVPNDSYPHAQFMPGALITVERHRHKMLGDDVTTYRVIALAGDLMSNVLTPTLEG